MGLKRLRWIFRDESGPEAVEYLWVALIVAILLFVAFRYINVDSHVHKWGTGETMS